MNRSFQILLFNALLLLSFFSCSKNDEADDLISELECIIDSRCYIENVSRDNGKVIISLSDGRLLSHIESSFDLYTIGLDGFWYKNGSPTSSTINESLTSSIQASYPNDALQLVAIIEGFEDWSFYFSQLSPIVVKKNIYSQDFDDIKISINHRGYSIKAPENTIPAFILSRLNGFKYVEADVRFTSDGVPVLLHDPDIDRTSNGRGHINMLTYNQVRQLDFGSWKSSDFVGTRIPSLEEFLLLCHDLGLNPVLELKSGTQSQIHQIVDMVKDYGLLDRTMFISFSITKLKTVLETSPSSLIGYLVSNINNEVINNVVGLRMKNNSVVLDSSDYSDRVIQLCKSLDIPLWVWTINSRDIILQSNPYISAFTSDSFHAGRLLSEFNIL